MKTTIFLFLFVLLPTTALIAADGDVVPAAPDGILVPQPAGPANCVALRVEVPEDQMLAGVRWYNGSAAEAFPRIMATSGRDLFPPSTSLAVTLATDVQGESDGWTTLMFDNPVASQTGTLFLVFQYRAGYVPVTGSPAHGVGYSLQEDPAFHFVSGDGQKWFKVSSRYRLLVQPVLHARDLTVVALSQLQPEGTETPPTVKSASLLAYPNPFNPAVNLDLYLPAAGSVTAKIYDVRGRVVRRLFAGRLEEGAASLVWNGRDDSGRQAGSGVYWAQVQMGTDRLTQRVVMVK